MEYSSKENRREYFKVVLVRRGADEYVILKGPEEEKFLAGMLKDDYNSTRYEKMIQLLAEEVVQKEYREKFYAGSISGEGRTRGIFLPEENWGKDGMGNYKSISKAATGKEAGRIYGVCCIP